MQDDKKLNTKNKDMKKPIMIHVLAMFLISTLASCASCSSDLKESVIEYVKEEKPVIE